MQVQQSHAAVMSRGIEVILPVYNAPVEVALCLDALSLRLPGWATLQVCDDASTDPEIIRLLARHPLLARDSVRVIRNEENLGFIGNVNAALARGRDDVVLLNSDAVVTHGWLERIRACAESDERIASVTPFSNNAEICSFPEFCRPNPIPADPDRVAQAAIDAGPATYPDLPTGVGFCMYMRRAAIDEIGVFDRATFGHGYGEENDWSMRARAAGWRNVLCDDSYVVHIGGASFGPTGLRPGGEAMVRLLALHPDYNELVMDFISRDPLAARRQAIADQLELSAVRPLR